MPDAPVFVVKPLHLSQVGKTYLSHELIVPAAGMGVDGARLKCVPDVDERKLAQEVLRPPDSPLNIFELEIGQISVELKAIGGCGRNV